MKKIILLAGVGAIGAAAGAAGGLFLKPDAETAACVEPCSPEADAKSTEEPNEIAPDETAYITMKNQFVVPIIFEEEVRSFVVISLSLEIQDGAEETIYSHEPKLQDALLRVMFDHAYMGGFGGAFTESERMASFREALRETASSVVGDILIDVLITEMVRQEV